MDIEPGLLVVLSFGFLLGLKHATDADHVVAVASIVAKEQNIWQSIWIGASWGAGHSVPLVILGSLSLLLRDVVLNRYEAVASHLEIGVGIMLIYLGISTVWNVLRGKLHIHQHDHGTGRHVHVHSSHDPQELHEAKSDNHDGFFVFGRPMFRARSFAIGIVHGMAGSAAVMVALLPTIESIIGGIGYIVLFSFGTMLSMAALTLALAVPFRASATKQTLNSALTLGAGGFSVTVGIILITEIILDTEILSF